MSARYRVGVDIGGTFTDFVAIDQESRRPHVHKLLTTPGRPADAVIDGLRELLARLDARPDTVDLIVHGTTLASNALIERTGAKTALLTTKGFRDVLEIGTEQRYDTYDLRLQFPEPLAPRDRRLEIAERTTRDGVILQKPRSDEVDSALTALSLDSVEAVAVAFLNSYRNPENERAIARWIAERWPSMAVTLSSDISPEIREFDRTSTAVANAYLQPVIERYLGDLSERLEEMGVERRLLLMLSNGGTGTVELGRQQPVRLLESGPAAGIAAAAYYARRQELPSVISFDMGGTTAKVCLIEDGRVATTSTLEVARVHRFKPGSGLPIRTAAVDVLEVGGGGGSIAAIDSLGLLRVGPRSAGADPGPACYGRGGVEPTVTDANLQLGYLNPEYFLGGRMRLEPELARRAIEATLDSLGDATKAAWGIHSIVNEQMAAAVRVHCAERGADPRGSTLLAFGGAGPLHAARIARILGISSVVYPPSPGVNSAFGFLIAPLAVDLSRSLPSPLDEVSWAAVNALYELLRAEGRRSLAGADLEEDKIGYRYSADFALSGQSHEITVDIPAPDFDSDSAAELTARFREEYQRRYRRLPAGFGIQVVTWRLTVFEKREITEMAARSTAATEQERRSRQVHIPEAGGWIECPVVARPGLAPGATIHGPAIVEEAESTIILLPSEIATVLSDGCIETRLADVPREGRAARSKGAES